MNNSSLFYLRGSSQIGSVIVEYCSVSPASCQKGIPAAGIKHEVDLGESQTTLDEVHSNY